MKKVDFTGKFKEFDGTNSKYSYRNKDGEIEEKEFTEINIYLANSLGKSNSKDRDTMVRIMEFAKEIYTKKSVNVNKSDETFLINEIEKMNFDNLKFSQIVERFENANKKESKK